MNTSVASQAGAPSSAGDNGLPSSMGTTRRDGSSVIAYRQEPGEHSVAEVLAYAASFTACTMPVRGVVLLGFEIFMSMTQPSAPVA